MDRICFISLSAYGYFNNTHTAGGGAQRQLNLLSTYLSDAFDVHFIVGDYGQPEKEVRSGVTLHRSYTPEPDSTLSDRASQLANISSVMRQVDADVYIARCLPRKTIVLGLISKILGKPLVYNIATDSFTDSPPRGLPDRLTPLYRKFLGHSASVIAQTEKQRAKLMINYGISADVVPNGYPEANDLCSYNNRQGFLWVGRLDQSEKRPHMYLDVAAEVPESIFRMAATPGDDTKYQQRIENRASSLDNVRYLGTVPPDEIHQHYRKAIAVVNTSAADKEGFPNTFIEAWRYKTPTISLQVDPGRFVDIDDFAGFADGSFDEMIECINRLAEDPDKREQLAQPMYGYFQSEFEITKVAEKYANVLRRVLN